ncbi:MAG: YicC family protein [candidate division Zixibacteria bacterium]|nr:YicC family protein [candidate division Zixibacteria bacterium]
MNSMTGYGRADFKTKELTFTVEMSSVNNRFLEYSFRLPKQLIFLEPRVKELVASQLSRGKINLTINYEDYGFGIDRLAVNRNLADEAYKQLISLKKKYRLAGEIEIAHLLTIPDIFKVERINDLEKRLWPILKTTVTKAIETLMAMRMEEGNNLKQDILLRLNKLSRDIGEIEKSSPQNLAIYRDKLSRRMKEVLDNKTLEGARFEEEVAYLAERSDITEECVRFRSHLKQFIADIKKAGPVGKRLNFLLQELNREANTIGAKMAGAVASKVVLQLKEEIEKIREQIQNIE